MSQAAKVIIATGGGGGGIDTISGNTGGPVSPSGGGNINIVDPVPYGTVYGQGQIIGNLVANTLSVKPYISTSIQTTDSTADVVLWTLPISLSSSISFFAVINGVSSDYTAGLTGNASGGALRGSAGSPVEIGSSSITQDVTAGFTGTIDTLISGNDLQLVVTGEDGVTVNWTALIYFANQ